MVFSFLELLFPTYTFHKNGTITSPERGHAQAVPAERVRREWWSGSGGRGKSWSSQGEGKGDPLKRSLRSESKGSASAGPKRQRAGAARAKGVVERVRRGKE